VRSYHLWPFVVAALVTAALSVTALPVLAHEDVEVGPYALEVGWVDEPPLAGVKNAVFLSVVEKESGQPVEDISDLQVAISAGGSVKVLTMRPLGEETPGQFAGDFIPTRRGVYTVKLTGKIEETDFNVSQDIEEAEEAASIQFPEPLPDALAMNHAVEEAQAKASTAQTLAVIGIAVGVVGLALGALGMWRRS
jgi:hypothetical protein